MNPVALYRPTGSESSSQSKSESSSDDVNLEGIEGIIKGFGAISTEPISTSSVQKSMNQTVISDAICRNRLGTRSGVLTANHFCAIDEVNNASACMYDSGNAFVLTEDGTLYVAGVLSIVTNMCRPQFPALYTRVDSFIPWIEEYLELWGL